MKSRYRSSSCSGRRCHSIRARDRNESYIVLKGLDRGGRVRVYALRRLRAIGDGALSRNCRLLQRRVLAAGDRHRAAALHYRTGRVVPDDEFAEERVRLYRPSE